MLDINWVQVYETVHSINFYKILCNISMNPSLLKYKIYLKNISYICLLKRFETLILDLPLFIITKTGNNPQLQHHDTPKAVSIPHQGLGFQLPFASKKN